MPRTISVAVDDELYLLFHAALDKIAVQMGVNKITASVVLREYINRVSREATTPFEAGWQEGYRAGYGAVQRVIQSALIELQANPGLDQDLHGIGVHSPGRAGYDKG